LNSKKRANENVVPWIEKPRDIFIVEKSEEITKNGLVSHLPDVSQDVEEVDEFSAANLSKFRFYVEFGLI
jgi:hypothetical protein